MVRVRTSSAKSTAGPFVRATGAPVIAIPAARNAIARRKCRLPTSGVVSATACRFCAAAGGLAIAPKGACCVSKCPRPTNGFVPGMAARFRPAAGATDATPPGAACAITAARDIAPPRHGTTNACGSRQPERNGWQPAGKANGKPRGASDAQLVASCQRGPRRQGMPDGRCVRSKGGFCVRMCSTR